jgi:hypothetical protein
VAYYDQRHSGIDKTNILQVVIAVEGETARTGPEKDSHTVIGQPNQDRQNRTTRTG